MPSVQTLLLAFAATAAALPSTAQHPSKGFSVKQVKRPFKPLRHPLSAVVNAYNRYGGTLPHKVSVMATDPGTVVASPATNDREYTCPVTIGGQQVNLDFDTGSSDLWVFSNLTPANQTKGRPYYDITKSTTWKQLDGYTWRIGYADKSGCSGIVGTDVLNVGGMVVPNAPIEAALNVSSSFVDNQEIGGLLGLAYPKINTVKPVKQTPPFFEVMNSLPAPVFTAALKHNKPGSYDFGYIDKSKYTGDIHYTNINTTLGYWTFQSAGIKVGDTAIAASYPSVADTGTSILLMNDDVVSAYYAKVPGAAFNQQNGGYMYPCYNKGRMPPFGIEMGNGYYAIIAPELMTYASTFLGLNCFGALQSNKGMPYGLQILGDPLFKSQFVVHNGATNQIGFAPQA